MTGDRFSIIHGLVKTGYFLLTTLPAAGDDPEINTHKTDFSKRKMLSEGL
jgi:hypothetical protein